MSPSLTNRGQFHLKNAGVNHSIRSLSFFHIHEYSAFFSGYILDCSYNKGNVIKREHLKGKSCAQERKKKHQFRTVHCDTSRLGSWCTAGLFLSPTLCNNVRACSCTLLQLPVSRLHSTYNTVCQLDSAQYLNVFQTFVHNLIAFSIHIFGLLESTKVLTGI